VLDGLRRRRETGQGSTARLSLARSALELPLGGAAPAAVEPRLSSLSRHETHPQETPWGPAELLAGPLTIDGRPLHWDKPPRDLGADKPVWTSVSTD
jgi:hypothetical protein